MIRLQLPSAGAALALALAIAVAIPCAAAEETPATDPDAGPLNQVEGTPLSRYTDAVAAAWAARLGAMGLSEGPNQLADGRQVFVSSGSATVEVALEHPGFIESRGVAYEIAYLRAKAAMAQFLGTEIAASTSFELLENASWTEGQIADGERLSQLQRIRQKSTDLTEAQLDAALAGLDPDHDPDRYGSREERETTYRSAVERELRAAAARYVQGAMPLAVYEGPVANDYVIRVGLVWTARNARLAGVMGGSAVPLAGPAGQAVIEAWLPQTVEDLVARWGVHRLVNTAGEQVLVAFGQAAPRNTSPDRARRAEETALQVAALRAQAALGAFVGETVESESAENTQALALEYADAATAATVDRAFAERIRAHVDPVELEGVRSVGRWVEAHPVNGQRVAVAAVAWTPSGVLAARRVQETMRDPDQTTSSTPGEAGGEAGNGVILEGVNVDPDDL
ncbi:MAG: hypothetical protein OXF27_12920 [Acidobacteria bacterium]|nr:hypothetical protein [Acidobacteriota bacterium]